MNQSKHPKFIIPEFRTKSDFAIVHYAGRVDYAAGNLYGMVMICSNLKLGSKRIWFGQFCKFEI